MRDIGGDDASSAATGTASTGAVVRSSAAANITAKVATPHSIGDRGGVPGLAASTVDGAIGADWEPIASR
jgi:hypothetical protein